MSRRDRDLALAGESRLRHAGLLTFVPIVRSWRVWPRALSEPRPSGSHGARPVRAVRQRAGAVGAAALGLTELDPFGRPTARRRRRAAPFSRARPVRACDSAQLLSEPQPSLQAGVRAALRRASSRPRRPSSRRPGAAASGRPGSACWRSCAASGTGWIAARAASLDGEQLVQAGAAAIAGHAAFEAADRLVRPDAAVQPPRLDHLVQRLARGRPRRAALHAGHSVRTRRCASTPISVEPIRYGATPRSIRRVIAEAAVVGVQRARTRGGR